ncbi:RraA family protein [Bordetella genomosp. 12]|uniref:Putative 4-hydroxy-4-methyl-2-oxoglutarate aldolase n=1 Tax=Bordetella genomosp. 12 TaxID=463035 RepID=A0A261VCM7_9BORD|nr:4-hydroxy-4-methyl-2-oxoglutarate aldolase [Bordetella genomosp. 12]OZI70913.1 4-hydroxy-4-methyl-2-oxoglutarate aldolase [Bordetella genomosp. 12]
MKYLLNDMPPALDPAITQAFAGIETATIGHWHLFGFMRPEIRAMLRGKHVVGTAVTVAIPASDSTLLHHATGMLRPGDVLIVDRLGDSHHACWGGALTIAAKTAGAVGAVVDGACTDIAEIEASDFPIWAKGLSPITTRLHNLGGGMNIPVSCGGVPVLPGDIVLADDSGVLVMRREEAVALAERAALIQNRSKGREAEVANGAKLGEVSGATKMVIDSLA